VGVAKWERERMDMDVVVAAASVGTSGVSMIYRLAAEQAR